MMHGPPRFFRKKQVDGTWKDEKEKILVTTSDVLAKVELKAG